MNCPKCGESILDQRIALSIKPCCDQAARFLTVVLNSMKQVPRYFIPLPDGTSPYLERLVLREYADGSKDYLHIIWESDGDRDLHDHPFDFVSTIVWGSYKEELGVWVCQCQPQWFASEPGPCAFCCGPTSYSINEGKVYKAGDVNNKRAAQLHRLTLIDGPVVTLVRRGPKVRSWGFQTPDGWVHHKPYIAEKFPGAQPTEVD